MMEAEKNFKNVSGPQQNLKCWGSKPLLVLSKSLVDGCPTIQFLGEIATNVKYCLEKVLPCKTNLSTNPPLTTSSIKKMDGECFGILLWIRKLLRPSTHDCAIPLRKRNLFTVRTCPRPWPDPYSSYEGGGVYYYYCYCYCC